MSRRKIKVSFGETTDSTAELTTDEFIKSAISESAWQIGEAVINGYKRTVSRIKTLDGYMYKMKGVILDSSCVEAYNSTEFIEWRDK